MKLSENIEIELTNGDRVLVENNWKKVYDVKESEKSCITFSHKFPFFKVVKHRYVSFKIQTEYETLKSFLDPRYHVHCSLVQLAKMFDVDVKPFELNVVENDLKCV